MKTPMQELIEWCEKVQSLKQYDGSPRLREGIAMAKIKATELLAKEKQAIIDAANGGADIFATTFDGSVGIGEQYYNETYQ